MNKRCYKVTVESIHHVASTDTQALQIRRIPIVRIVYSKIR